MDYRRAQIRTCHSLQLKKRENLQTTGNLWPRAKPADQCEEGPEGFNWLVHCPARRPRRTRVRLLQPVGGRESVVDAPAQSAARRPWTRRNEWTSATGCPAGYPPDLFHCPSAE